MCKRKTMITGLLVIITLASVAAADTTQRIRHVEFSIAGSMQAFVSDGDHSLMMNMPVRIGAFVTRDFEIEAEGILTVGEGYYNKTVVGYIASLNGSYNFRVDRLISFALLGYGFTDSAPIGNVVAGNNYNDMTLSVLNAGFGWKFLFTPKAALRVEYRLQKFSGRKTYTYTGYYGGGYESQSHTYDVDFTIHSIFFGVSLFF